MRRATILVAILAFTPLASATAQVRPGARVRVTRLPICPPTHTTCVGRSPRQDVGTFVRWSDDTLLVLSNGNTLALPLDAVTRLDVSRGRKTNTGKGAEIGFLLGGVVGAVIGYASYEECVPQGPRSWSCIGPNFGSEGAALGGALLGGLGGGVVGALIGASSKTDRWQEVPLDRVRVSLGPQRDGRFGLGASVRF